MQNLVSIQYTDEEIAQMDAALNTLRVLFSRMIALQPDERRELTKLGPKSQAFCDQALAVLLANPQIVPPSLEVLEALVRERQQALPLDARLARADLAQASVVTDHVEGGAPHLLEALVGAVHRDLLGVDLGVQPAARRVAGLGGTCHRERQA